MNEKDRSNYVDHILWHIHKIQNLISVKADPMPELNKIRAHLMLEDLNAIEDMKNRKEPKRLASLIRFPILNEEGNEGIDASEKLRIQHNEDVLDEIHYIMTQFGNRRIIVSEQQYAQMDEARKTPLTPEEEEEDKRRMTNLLKKAWAPFMEKKEGWTPREIYPGITIYISPLETEEERNKRLNL